MDDCISREAILDAFANKFCAYCPLTDCDTNCKLCYLIDTVKEEPAADVRPVVRGKWIVHTSDLFPTDSTIECNQCHAEQPAGIDDNFCPNCGADMRGE